MKIACSSADAAGQFECLSLFRAEQRLISAKGDLLCRRCWANREFTSREQWCTESKIIRKIGKADGEIAVKSDIEGDAADEGQCEAGGGRIRFFILLACEQPKCLEAQEFRENEVEWVRIEN